MMENIFSKAKAMIEMKRYDEALDMLVPLFEEREKDDELYFLMGTCFLEKEDTSNAVRFFQKAVDLNPLEERYLLALGSAHEAFGDIVKAMDTYLKVLVLSPESVVASERMLKLAKLLGKP
jgi:tetratricopeptide (TPR) repeat protein